MKSSRNKRILLLNYEFPPLGGGGGVAAHKLAKGFIELGHEVHYVTTGFKGLKSYELVDDIHVHRVPVKGRNSLPTASLLSMLTFLPAAKNKVRELAKQHDFDIINTHFAVPTGPVGVWASRELGIPNILSLHGGDLYDPSKALSPHRHFALRQVVKWVLRNSSVLVAQSSNTKSNAEHYYGAENVKIIPLAYEPFSFKRASRKELGLDAKQKYVVSVGRLVKRKAYDKLIHALSLTPGDVSLLIIGDGPEEDALRELTHRLGMEDWVHFLGRQSDERKFQYLASADLYALSSLHEGFGIVLQEAMQVGLPIVSTNVGGQTDLIDEGENGFLVPINHQKIAESITKVLKDSQLSKKFGKKNAASIDAFNVKNIAAAYLQ